MSIITVWERLSKKGYKHNHIDDGYDVSQDKPIPKSKYQEKMWKNAQWRKTKGKLINHKVVK